MYRDFVPFKTYKAVSHHVIYIRKSMIESVQEIYDPKTKSILRDACMIFCAGSNDSYYVAHSCEEVLEILGELENGNSSEAPYYYSQRSKTKRLSEGANE